MNRTDVDGVSAYSKGVLIGEGDSSYHEKRRRILDERKRDERINMLEGRLSNIENLLQQLINQKVN